MRIDATRVAKAVAARTEDRQVPLRMGVVSDFTTYTDGFGVTHRTLSVTVGAGANQETYQNLRYDDGLHPIAGQAVWFYWNGSSDAYVVSKPAHAQHADEVVSSGCYTDWFWSRDVSYSIFDMPLMVQVDPAPAGIFWSTQMYFEGGDGGYMGIQANDGTHGKIALFSIWSALDSWSTDTAGPFSGEGTGQSTRILLPWIQGNRYIVRIAADTPYGVAPPGKTNAAGRWWSAYVVGQLAGDAGDVTRHVGSIQVPSAWGLISGFSVSFTENFIGKPYALQDLPYCMCRFGPPTMDGAEPALHINHVADGDSLTANNSRVRDCGNPQYDTTWGSPTFGQLTADQANSHRVVHEMHYR